MKQDRGGRSEFALRREGYILYRIPNAPSCGAALVDRSQILTALSSQAEVKSLPSGEKTTALTKSQCPSSVCRASPVKRFQLSLIVPSYDEDATGLLSRATA